MQNRGYVLLSLEKRREQYNNFLTDSLLEYERIHAPQMKELLERQRQRYEESLCKAFDLSEDFLRSSLSSQRKGRLKYIHFSYLLSGALSEEHLIKLDFYDHRHYQDPEEIECFWNCKGLFPWYEEEYRNLEGNLRKEIPRIKSGELSRLRVALTSWDYLMLKPILMELVKGETFLQRICPYCGSTAYILYGGYLDMPEVLWEMKEGSK